MKKKLLSFLVIGGLIFSTAPIYAATEADQELIDSQKDTENSAVYAEELGNNIGHIDGPIEVEIVSDSTTINYNYGQGGDSGKDSYIGETTNGAKITTNDNVHKDEVINIGENVDVNEQSGTANHTPVVELTEEEVEQRNQAIENVLNDIAQKGDKAIALNESSRINNEEDLINRIKEVKQSLKTSSKTDFFVINIDGALLSDGNNYDSLNKELSGLISENKNESTILINVKIPDTNSYVIASVEMNRGYESYDPLANYLYWNFGSFDKEITINSEWGGVILAPLAEVNLKSGIHSGRVVAKIVTTGGEIHTSVIEEPPEEPEEPEKPSVEEPTEPDEPEVTEPEEPTKTTKIVEKKTTTDSPQTGDDFTFVFLIFITFITAGCIILCVYKLKKE